MPLVEVPEAITKQFARYRDIFCREAGFEHVQRYVGSVQETMPDQAETIDFSLPEPGLT